MLGGDRLGGAVRERHDRDHRVRARGRRERAAVADPHALGVVQLAPRVGNARRGVVPHPAGAHLVRAEEPEAAGPQGHALPALDAIVEIVAVAPARRAAGHRLDLACAGRRVQARLRVDRPVRVAHVELVGEVVVRDRLAVRVDLDPAVAVVAQQADEGAAVADPLHHLLVPAGVRERQRGPDQRRRVLRRLDQEAVAVLDRCELVHEPGLRRAPPGVLVLAVDAEQRGAGMDPQVVPDRGAADLRAHQQRRRLERAGRDHDLRRAHRHASRAAGLGIGPRALDARRVAVLDQHALDRAAHDDVGAGVEGVLQVGPLGAQLRPGLVAEADVGRRRRVVTALVGVPQDGLPRPPELVRALLHALVRAVQVRAAVVDRQALEDRVEVAVEVGPVDALEAVLARPLLPHPRPGAKAVGPVDDGPAAEARARVDGHVEVGRRLWARRASTCSRRRTARAGRSRTR